METFERVRLIATNLNSRLVNAGIDSLNSQALVVGAITSLGLELVALPSKDPALKGAQALFDAQSGLICYEAQSTDAESALLIAHELGHACIHESSCECKSADIDPSCSEERSPVGLQRVEDYGIRERRELQANVFAREFLFPKSLARELFLNQKLSASQIQNKIGIPKNLVRQQILDAVLLPIAPDAEDRSEHSPALKPDDSQIRAAKHRDSPFLLQAGPGTGKTRTLVTRVLGLLDEKIDPSTILGLTFSNRAANELTERIALAAPEAASRMWLGTFHAFGLDLVRRYHEQLGLSQDPILFDASDAIEVLEDILPTLPLTHYRNLWDPVLVLRDIVFAISRAKDELTTPSDYRRLAEQMLRDAQNDDEKIAAEKCMEVSIVYELYDRSLRERGALDFGDLIMKPALLLESDPQLRKSVEFRHRHILVDEYQDVNRASARLLKCISGDGKRLWVVGDSRQSIYRFRGASSSNMGRFSSEYSGATIDQLDVNYRSTSEIVDLFCAVAPKMGASEGMLPLKLKAYRGAKKNLPQIRRYETLDDEICGLASSIRHLEKEGISLRSQAVLCRGNNRLSEIAQGLEDRGVPILHLGSLFERDEVRDLLSLMSFATQPFGPALVRIGAMKRYQIPLQDVYLLIRELAKRTESMELRSIGDLQDLSEISDEGRQGFARLQADLKGVSASWSPWEFLTTYLLDRTDLIRELALQPTVQLQIRCLAIWQFLNFLREQHPSAVGVPIQQLLNRIRRLVLLSGERDLRQLPAAARHLQAVHLLTIHGSKGLEFDAVHLPGLTKQSFPLTYRSPRCPSPSGMIENATPDEAKIAHTHEEECLFFVGVSRARCHLIVHLSQKQPNGNKRAASEFLGWLPQNLSEEISKPNLLPPSGIKTETNVNVVYPDNYRITNNRLALYEKCPRRYLYTHVLALGVARKATAFSRTHDCLYELIGWLSKARQSGEPTTESAEAAFDEIWLRNGPTEHGLACDYRKLASRLIATLLKVGAGKRFRDAQPLALDLPSGRVIVEPDEMLELPNGAVVLRRVRTGSKRSDEYDRLDYTLYELAGRAHFEGRFKIEAVHLSDETVEVVTITGTKVENRSITSDSLLSEINAGKFPPKADAISCPRCPHFFACATPPRGNLTIIQSK